MSKKKTALVVAFVVMGVAALGLGAAVYAKYIASLQASGTAHVAKWAFSSENSRNNSASCVLFPAPKDGTVATGTPTIIAPGTSGTCTLELSNSQSEVAVDYTITVITAGDEKSSNVPTNLKLSSDGLNYGSLDDFTTSGSIAAGASGTKTVTIHWQWPYEGADSSYDEDDTEDGEAGNNMQINFKIDAVQHNPSDTL